MRQAPIPARPMLSAATPEARPTSAPAYKGSQETVEAAKVLQTNIMLSEFFFIVCLFVGFLFCMLVHQPAISSVTCFLLLNEFLGNFTDKKRLKVCWLHVRICSFPCSFHL